MRYQGGKSRIARPIVETIRRMYPAATEIWEPFCGGGAVTLALSKVGFKVHASDNHEDLILMWQAAMRGDSAVFVSVSEDEFKALKHAPPSARRGFVRFGASFGGDFNAGYGRHGTASKPNREFCWQDSQRAINKLVGESGRGIEFSRRDYQEIPADALVYADPPYSGTYKYQGREFDHTSFWQWVRERNGPTFVSELTGPDDMHVVWCKAHKSQMSSNSPTSAPTSSIVHREERLYHWPGRV